MEDRDKGGRTTALVTALWRAPWIHRWFVQTTVVWFEGARLRLPPHGRPPPVRTLVEVEGPLVCGGGTTANVGEATCAMGWP